MCGRCCADCGAGSVSFPRDGETDRTWAKTLAAFLKKYRQMGVLDFKGMDKKQIFAELRSCFPTMRHYSYSNFIYYF